MRRVEKEWLRRETQQARMKLETQEWQPDCQATCSHGNGKWREQGGEVVKQREKKKLGRCFRLKLHFREIKKELSWCFAMLHWIALLFLLFIYTTMTLLRTSLEHLSTVASKTHISILLLLLLFLSLYSLSHLYSVSSLPFFILHPSIHPLFFPLCLSISSLSCSSCLPLS